ncbi:MAG TPA: molybdopterin-dependent oxidoreductase, partial [Chloroflexota bacterium]|nr:molybdopterin-dependent oxidoreductase [Chloroflexota bacterium]
EDAFVLQKFGREVLGTPNIDSTARAADWPALKAIRDAGLTPLDDLNAQVRKAEVIVVVGDASQAADIASIKLQNSSRYSGATIVQINPYRTQLSKWQTIDIRCAPLGEAAVLAAIAARVAELRAGASDAAAAPRISGTLPSTPRPLEPAENQAAELIANARSVLFALCTGHWLRGRAADVGAALSNLVLASGKISGEGTGVVFLPEKNNSMGTIEGGLLADLLPGYKPAAAPGETLDRMLADDSGVQALYVAGENIYDRRRGLPFLIVQDILMSETAKRADVLFPASSYAERQGTFTNFEGRAQWFNRAIPPVGQSRPDWQITAELARRVAEKLGKDANGWSFRSVVDITRQYEQATGKDIPDAPILPTGAGNPVGNLLHGPIATAQELRKPETPLGAQGDSRFNPRPAEDAGSVVEGDYRYQPVNFAPAVEGQMVLITGPQRWVNGATSRYADGLLGLYPTARVAMSPADARELGIADNDEVRVSSATGGVLMTAEVTHEMPRGVALIPGYVQPSFVISEGEAVAKLLGPNVGAAAVKIEKREERELGFAGFNRDAVAV